MSPSVKDRAWLARFIADPKSVLDSGDAYAIKLRDEARGVVMPNVPGMTIDRAMNLLDLIEAESAWRSRSSPESRSATGRSPPTTSPPAARSSSARQRLTNPAARPASPATR